MLFENMFNIPYIPCMYGKLIWMKSFGRMHTTQTMSAIEMADFRQIHKDLDSMWNVTRVNDIWEAP